ncbi:MAG: helix-turn-helix domain-containing protein [Bacteroides sp.]|nr:helix-turn-helix domain-containing protein [Bacteroides sp.]
MFHRADATLGRRFSDEVERHFRESRNTGFYVQLLGVGEKVLAREVKALTGKTPKMYIDSRVILEAKRLLAHGNGSIKAISIELGFEEPTNFNKYFRKHTTLTPVKFRQKSIKL